MSRYMASKYMETSVFGHVGLKTVSFYVFSLPTILAHPQRASQSGSNLHLSIKRYLHIVCSYGVVDLAELHLSK